jgi:hypothetical protein
MKELTKDLLICCIIMLTDIIYMPLPIFLPYLYSYLKNLDEYIKFSWCYSLLVFLYLGNILANYILPNLFIILGIKRTFALGGIIYFVNSTIFVLYPNRYTVLIFGIVGGVTYSFKVLPTNYYLCSKYKNGIDYLPYSYIGQSLGVLLWSFLMMQIINPDNKSMEGLTFINGYEENYFEADVSKNTPFFISVNGIVSLLAISISAYFLKEPDYLQGELVLWLKSYFFKDKNARKILKGKFLKMEETRHFTVSIISRSSLQLYENISFQSRNASAIIEHEKIREASKQIELNESLNQTNSVIEELVLLEEEVSREIWSLKFIGFIIITTIKNNSSTLMIDCFKLMALKIIQNDYLSSVIYCFITFADIFGRFFVPYSWKKYGFFNTYLMNFFFDYLFLLIFILWGFHQIFGFIISITIASLIWAFGYLLGNTTIFALFRPSKAIRLIKAFDFYLFFQSVLSVIITYVFMDKGMFRETFFLCFLMEIVVGYVFFTHIKNSEI